MKVAMMRLAALFALCAACGTSTTPPSPSGPPRVVGLFAVDSAGTQPEVLLWSGFGVDPETNLPPQTAPAFPAGYRGLRVEFDQLLDPSTAASDETFGPRSGPNAAFSYCPPLSTPGVQLFDGSREIGLSVCYTPNALIGTRPSLFVTIGANSISTAAQPFTCKDFSPAGAANATVLTPGKGYRLQVSTATLRGKTGAGLVSPAGSSAAGSWDGSGSFSFTASGFEPMVVGYTDSQTSFNYFPRKFYAGYAKNKLEEAQRLVPADRTPVFVPMTLPVKAATLPGNVTIKRSDGSTYSDVGLGLRAGPADLKQIVITPAATWEPNQTYTVALGTGLTALDGTALSSASAATFSTADAPNTPVSVLPLNGSLANVAVNFEGKGQPKLVPSVLYGYPIDPATVTPANVQLQGPGGPVAGTPGLTAGTNRQRVQFTTAQRLQPGATYQLSVNNLVSSSPVANLNGKSLAGSTSSFTTARFHSLRVGVKSGANTTDSFAEAAAAATKAGKVPLGTALIDGTLRVVFNDLAVNVVGAGNANLDNLKVVEGSTPIPAANVQITPDSAYQPADSANGAYSAYLVKLVGYAPRLGTSYQIRLTPAIKDVAGNAVTAEGCDPRGTADCSDVAGFVTGNFAGSLAKPDDSNLSAVKFTVKFNAPIDPASVNQVLADWSSPTSSGAGFHLYQVNATGDLTELASGGKPQLSCAASGADAIVCTATTALSPSTAYSFSATFTTDSPARVAPSFGVDTGKPSPPQAGPSFVGVLLTSNFVSRCGP